MDQTPRFRDPANPYMPVDRPMSERDMEVRADIGDALYTLNDTDDDPRDALDKLANHPAATFMHLEDPLVIDRGKQPVDLFAQAVAANHLTDRAATAIARRLLEADGMTDRLRTICKKWLEPDL